MPNRKITFLLSAIGLLICIGLTASATAAGGASIEHSAISGVAQNQAKPGASNGQTANPCTTTVGEIISSENMGAIGANTLRGVAVISADDIWAVGYITEYGSYKMLTMHWDGVQWTVIPTGLPGRLFAVMALASDNVWAVGSERILHWDGLAWSLSFHAQGTSATVFHDIDAASSNDIWAIGSYYQEEQQIISFLMRWNGTQWNNMPLPQLGPQNTLYSIEVVSANDVWVAGGGHSTGGYLETLIMHWNGSTWTETGTPPGYSAPEGPIKDIIALAGNDIWAVGWDVDNNPSRTRSITLHWNGSTWNEIPNPGVGRLNRAIALAPDDIWAVGVGTTLHWDGTQWSDSGLTKSLYDVAVLPSGELWAVGDYRDPVNRGNRTLTLRYDGQTWNTVPSPDITAMSNNLAGVAAISSNDVWAVGGYSINSGTDRHGVS